MPSSVRWGSYESLSCSLCLSFISYDRARDDHILLFSYIIWAILNIALKWCVKNCLLDSKWTWSQWKINVFDLYISCEEGRASEKEKLHWIKQTCQCDGLSPWNHQIFFHLTFFFHFVDIHRSFICIIPNIKQTPKPYVFVHETKVNKMK